MKTDPDVSVKTKLRIVALLAVAYFFLEGGWAVLVGSIGWNIVSAILLLLTPVTLSSIWNMRKGLGSFDWRVLYLPLLVWAAASAVIKYISWAVTRGHPMWYSYGGDKGLANALVEPGIVAIATLLYFVGIRISGANSSLRRRRWLFAVALFIAASTAIIVPPLPE